MDPYHLWLGIPPDEQPAHHYRLLGIRLFEGDADVIENAADQRMAHLRNFQSGKHSGVCAKILNEVAAAKVCLLDPRKKTAYDRQLGTQLAAIPPTLVPPNAPGVSMPPPLPPAPGPAVPHAQPVPGPIQPVPFPGAAPGADSTRMGPYGGNTAPTPAGVSVHRHATPRHRSGAAFWAASAIVGLLVVLGAIMLARSLNQPAAASTALVFEWSAEDGGDVTLAVDGAAVATAGRGPWTHPCAAGEHRVNAARPGYRSVRRTVEVEAGEQLAVNVTWVKAPEGKPARVKGGEKPHGPKTRAPVPPDPVVTVKPSGEVPARDLPVEVAGMMPVPFEAPGSAQLPEFLKGGTTFDFPQKPRTDARNGVLEFTVKRTGVLYLLADWKHQGNPRGGWEQERPTRQQLAERGWKDLGPTPWDKEVIVFEKTCNQGETYTIRTNKYWSPILVVPAAGAPPPEAGQVITSTPKPPEEMPKERLPGPRGGPAEEDPHPTGGHLQAEPGRHGREEA